MINIHKQLWVVKSKGKADGSDFSLAYMTHTEFTKTGEETKAFLSRKGTGTNWSGRSKGLGELTLDNNPISGFRIVGSVSRWSTSNKLIRVEDPRGFVVEIPTGNLTTLLKYVTVRQSVVEEDCVWGREDSNHILLPVNSEEYKEGCIQTKANEEKISFSKLGVGQVVRFSVDDECEYIYLGRGKAKWRKEVKQASMSFYGRWGVGTADPTIESSEVTDTKLCFIFRSKEKFIFRSKEKLHKDFRWECKGAGKCVVEGITTDLPEVESFETWVPERVSSVSWMTRRVSKEGACSYYSRPADSTGRYSEFTSIGVEMKPEGKAKNG